MKRFIAVLSGLLVLPAFAEVVPAYYDEIVEYTDDTVNTVNDEVEEEVIQQIAPVASQRATVNRATSASRALPVTGTNVTQRSNTSSRAIASSPRSAASRATTSRTARTATVVNRPTSTNSRSAVTSRNSTTTKPVTARVGTSGNNVMATGRGTTYSSQQTLTDSGKSLYNSNTVSRVGVGGRRTSARISAVSLTPSAQPATVITEEDVSTTTSNLTAITELTEYCKAQYAACMDNYCNVLDDNQGRCSCSKNIKNYEKTEQALAEATEQFQDVVQKIRYIGLTPDQITSLFAETEAELTMSKETDKSAIKSSLDRIREKVLVDASSPRASSYTSGIDFDLSGLLNFDSSAGNFDLSALMGTTSNTNAVTNQRGEQLYKSATQRCKTNVLNSCTAQGIDANVITNSYDLEIDKQCIAYERSLNDANEEMRTNARNAANILQQARLMLAQQKNSYDLRGCIAALDSCMQDEYVCGDDYNLCLDSTGKYINEGKLISGSMPGVANGTPKNSGDMSTSGWVSGGMYDLYSAWDYGDDNTVNGSSTTYKKKNAWGAGEDENVSNFIDSKVSKWNPAAKNASEDMATYLLKKIGYIDSNDKANGMCASVFKQCQDYTYTTSGNKYNPDNAVVRQYLANALTKIKLQQDTILSNYAEGCKSDITSCLNTNGYDSDKSSNSTVNTQAIRACASQIVTCMSVTGYKPNDPTKIDYKAMSNWTSAVISDYSYSDTASIFGISYTDVPSLVGYVGDTTSSQTSPKTSKASNFGLSSSDVNTWAAEYASGTIIKGKSLCSTVEYNNGTVTASDATGKECYCRLTTISNASYESEWVYNSTAKGTASVSDTDTCKVYCAQYCADSVASSATFRASILDTIE